MIDKNKICYIFDMDGTLTKPRKPMMKEHKDIFLEWAKEKQCFISTGSDYSKVVEQLDKEIIDSFNLVFCCMGNEARDRTGNIVRKNHFIVPEDLNIDLANFMETSGYKTRAGQHFEVRTGMLNFSIVGRLASQKQRADYYEWDKKHNERRKIANFINKRYPELEASVGGTISIDIIQKNCDKGQVVDYLANYGARKIVFVGDRCQPGGNDYGVIRELKKSDLAFEWYDVVGPNDTFKLIKENKIFRG